MYSDEQGQPVLRESSRAEAFADDLGAPRGPAELIDQVPATLMDSRLDVLVKTAG